MKTRQVKRDWSEALRKLERECCCRVCGSTTDLQAAHTIGRARQDVEVVGPRGGKTLVVKEDSIIPLCQPCHEAYDARRLDLLPYLFLPEQVAAVEAAGGIASANARLSGSRDA
jgi:5-methylcytosine-specific restriction endonuclease McrA